MGACLRFTVLFSPYSACTFPNGAGGTFPRRFLVVASFPGEEMVPAVLLFMNRAATAPLSYIEYQPGGAGLSEPVEIGTIECGAQYSGTTATLCGSAVGDPRSATRSLCCDYAVTML